MIRNRVGVFLGLCMVLSLSVMGFDASGSENETKTKAGVSMEKQDFGKTADGQAVDLYTLQNAKGMKVRIMTYGGIIVSIEVPDKDGKSADVTLGFDSLEGYLGKHPYFGSIVGRYGNRICKGKFTLDGKEYTLAINNGENALHGGLKGFDKAVWKASEIERDGQPALKLTYLSKDGEEGFPGNLQCTVIYSIADDNELMISYELETDKATPINITNHTYFNLAGEGKGTILDHVAMLKADRFTPVDETLIPIGELRSVKDTPMDFSKPTRIGDRIDADDQQIKFGGGYDHNWVLNSGGGKLALGGRVCEPTSGRILEFYTTEPGVQFYCGNFLDGSVVGKGGKAYKRRYGFCLETQHFPDSPNQPNFPSVILQPGKCYKSMTVYKFSTK